MIIEVRFMKKSERNKLPEGYKKHPLIKEFPGVWTRFKNWEANPPMVALNEKRKIVGFHVATFNKKLYINSYYLYVDDEYRGKGVAGALFEYSIIEAQKRGLTRYKNACMAGADGERFYRGFNLKPIARNEDHIFFDFSIAGVKKLSQLSIIKDEIPIKAFEFHKKKGRELLIPEKQITFNNLERMFKL
jgi:GNAT superfamily N-acetyltransferase